jgi:hypothetical protein
MVSLKTSVCLVVQQKNSCASAASLLWHQTPVCVCHLRGLQWRGSFLAFAYTSSCAIINLLSSFCVHEFVASKGVTLYVMYFFILAVMSLLCPRESPYMCASIPLIFSHSLLFPGSHFVRVLCGFTQLSPDPSTQLEFAPWLCSCVQHAPYGRTRGSIVVRGFVGPIWSPPWSAQHTVHACGTSLI